MFNPSAKGGGEEDFLAAFSEQGKQQRRKVHHSKSNYKGPKNIYLKELFQGHIPITPGDEVLAPSPRQQVLGRCPFSGERQQLRQPHAQHFILAGFRKPPA